MRAAGIQQALSPVMDVARDARWGRVHETYGEDPYLCAQMSMAFVRGLQGGDLAEGVIATGKHFLGYGWSEAGQNMASTRLGDRELYDVYAFPFEAAIREAGLASMMNSYSEIDGVPVVASSKILTDLLRDRLGFGGLVVSDYFAVAMLMTRFATAGSLQEAGAIALRAGMDMELPFVRCYGALLVDAVRQGQVEEGLVDRSVRRVLEAKARLGLLDRPVVDATRVPEVFGDARNRALSRTLADKSLTLLRNEGNLLPLDKGTRRVAVIGPHAASVTSYFPGYTFPAMLGMVRSRAARDIEQADAPQPLGAYAEDASAKTLDEVIRERYPVQSLLEAIRAAVSEGVTVGHATGCEVVSDDASGIAEAEALARDADVAILALGGQGGWMHGGTEGEGVDSADIDLPGVQQRLLEAVVSTGTPTVLVLFGGRPYAIAWAAEHVPAILAVYYPGQEGADAIAAALFGDAVPGGKLPYSIPRHAGQAPVYLGQRQGSGYRRAEDDFFRGYADMPATPLYPLGHGLSYTTWEYGDLRIGPREVEGRGQVEVACTVRNSGTVGGEEVVQLYVRDRVASVARPTQQLIGFRRIALAPGEACSLTFRVPMALLAFLDRDMRLVVEPGAIDVMVGSSSDDIRLRGEFEIVGEVAVHEGRAFASEVEVAG